MKLFTKKSPLFVLFFAFSFFSSTVYGAWDDNLIFYAPFNDKNNPLQVSVGEGQFNFSRITPATYIDPDTGFVKISASNIIPSSEDFSAWVSTSSQVIVNQVIAPDGTMTADQLVVGPASDGSRVHYVEMAATSSNKITTSQIFTTSVYVKQNTNTWVGVSLIGKSGTINTCYFNTTNGSMGTCTANTYGSSTPEANGFYRLSVGASLSTGASIVKLRIYLANGDNSLTWTGDGEKSVYVWGGHMNFGPILTEYLKTTTDSAAQPRIESGGYFSESTRTNFLQWSRDLSKSVWTKSNVTVSKTATGHDGVPNSASVLTATADNATVCQGVTLVASSSGSVDIMRISGNGSVSISMNGGSTYSADFSEYLSESSWYRPVYENQKITNPSFCIKLGSNGDSIAVDYAQLETSGTPSAPTGAIFSSSRIPTATTSNTRFIDKLSIQSSGNWSGTEGSLFAIADTWDTYGPNKYIIDVSTLVRVPMHIRSGQGNGSAGIPGRTTIYDGASECSYSSTNIEQRTSTKIASRWSATLGIRSTTASGAVPTNCAFDGAIENDGLFVIGDTTAQDGSRTLWGHVKQLRIYNTAFSDENMQLATSGNLNDIGTPPSTPNSLSTSSVTSSSVTLDWQSPTSNGGSAITNYLILYSSGGASTTWVNSPSTSTTATISGLSSNTSYQFSVAAINSVGTSSFALTSAHTLSESTPPSTTTPIVSNERTITSGTTVQNRYKNLITIGNIRSAIDLRNQYPHLFEKTNFEQVNSGVRFNKNLDIGAIDMDVKELQILLNKKGFVVSQTGPGSIGQETNVFGELTQKALIRFQKANDIYPANGSFGSKTREYLNK